jgi:hypothetical protein
MANLGRLRLNCAERDMFFFPCPSCSFRMQSTADRIGQKALCPKCYQPVNVPDPQGPIIAPDDTVPTEREPDLKSRRVSRVMAPIAARTLPREDAGGVVLFQGIDTAFSPSDCMTQLTSAITMRMKPPPEPPAADFKLSTAIWVILTGVGIVLWLATVIYQTGPLHYVTALAVVLLSIGFGWVAYLAVRQSRFMGVVTLLPPVAIFRLFNGDGRDNHRPLRYVLSGLLLLALVYANPIAREAVRTVFGMDEPKSIAQSAPLTPAETVTQLLTKYDRQPLIDELDRLAKSAAPTQANNDERQSLITILKQQIAADDRPEITISAIKALVTWAGDDSRSSLIQALNSNHPATRHSALLALDRWKDAEVAKAITPLLVNYEERKDVTRMLVAIGQPA